MRVKTEAATKAKSGFVALLEPLAVVGGHAARVQQKKTPAASRSKAAARDDVSELGAEFAAAIPSIEIFLQQEALTPTPSSDDSVALAAVDPSWYVEPGTTPSATDAPKPNWLPASPAPQPAASEPTAVPAAVKAPTPAEVSAVVRGPTLSPIGLNSLGIGLGGLALAGGVGGGSGDGGNTVTKVPTSSIKVVDGPISGASVYWDMNDNGKYDANVDKLVETLDARGTTDTKGSVDITTADRNLNGKHGLLALGGFNDNGMPNVLTLSLAVLADDPAALVVLSPLTSLVSAVYLQARQSHPKASFTDAENAVKSALGIDTGERSLSSIDPTGAEELALLKAGVVLASLSAVPEAVATSALQSLASYVLSNKPQDGALLDQLSSGDGLQTLFASSLDGFSLNDRTAADTTLSAMASNNARLLEATSATELSSIANLSSNENSAPKIWGLSYDTGTSDDDQITSLKQLSISTLGGNLELSFNGGKWVTVNDFDPPDGTVTVVARSNYGKDSAGNTVVSASSDAFEFTLITKVPPACTIALDNDTGVSTTDHITQDGSFSLNTTSDNAGAQQYTLEYSTDGRNWGENLTPEKQAALEQDGAHTVYVRQYLPIAGLSSAVNQLYFTLDTFVSAGTTSVLEIEGADASSTDGITRNDQPTLQGDTDPGNTVAFSLGDTTHTVIADAKGHWSFNPALAQPAYTFPEGSVDIALTISDAAGNAATAILRLTIDTTAPDDTTVSFNPPTSDATVGVDADGVAYFYPNAISEARPLTFSGTADPGAKVELYVADTLLDTVTASADDGSWSFDWDGLVDGSALAEETYTLQLVVTDLAGNISDTLDGTVFTVDATAPDGDTVTPDAMASDATFGTDDDGVMYFNAKSLNKETPLRFSGTADTGASVALYIADSKVATDTADDGSWSFDWDGLVNGTKPDDGSYTASVVVTDLAGNVSKPLPAADGNMAFVIDTKAPVASNLSAVLADEVSTVTDPNTKNVYVTQTDFTLVGTAEASVPLLILVGDTPYEASADGFGNWRLDLSLEDGSFTVLVSKMDLAGNASDPAKGPSFIVDTTAPDDTTVSFNPPTSEATVGVDADGVAYFNPNAISEARPLTFSGTADLGAKVELYVADTLLDTVTASADQGSWSFNWGGLVDGLALIEDTYTLKLVVKDLAGNVSNTLDGTVFTVDATAPDGDTVTPAAMASEGTHGIDDDGVMYFNADSLNSDTPLRFSGSADVGATVDLYIADTLVVTVTTEDGNWFFDWDGLVDGSMPDDGSYTASVVVTDLAGNVSDRLPASDGDMAFVIDNEVPDASDITAALDDGLQTGTDPSTDEVYTNLADVTVVGTAGALALLLVTVDGQDYEVSADDSGSWSLDLTGLADNSYTVTVTTKDLAGNASKAVDTLVFTVDTVPEYFSGSADAGYGPVIGSHIAKVVGTDENVDLNLIDNLAGHVAPSTGYDYADYVEDYSGTLPEGLTLEEDGRITGTPTDAGQTWLAVHSFDFAGNESITYVQLVVTSTASEPSTSTVSASGATAKQYTASDEANTINITASAGVVVFAGLGGDTINIGKASTSTVEGIKSSAVPFARIDGGDDDDGGEIDSLSFLYKGESIDLSNFNNPDGSGGVIQHVEQLKFAGGKGAESSVTLTAADVFHLQSDATDTDGRALLVLTAASASSNQFVTAVLSTNDFTQVGNDRAYNSAGDSVTGSGNANYNKFHGSYTDHTGTHDLAVLVQGYFVLG